MNKKVSIIMGVYNCADSLRDAMDSICSQSYSNWELIICDDGSTDDTFFIARSYAINRKNIVLVQNKKNMGLNLTLNRCLELASGDYIARMDGDDISLPDRLKTEVDFLNNHPEYSFVSCPMIYFDESGDWGIGASKPSPEPIDFLFGTPFCHAPCMIRAEALRSVGGYSLDRRTVRAEDYDLWFRLYEKGYRGYNIQSALYKMRDGKDAYRRRKFKYALNEAFVRSTGFYRLKLPVYCYIWVFRPIMVSLLPKYVYLKLHHKKKSTLKYNLKDK